MSPGYGQDGVGIFTARTPPFRPFSPRERGRFLRDARPTVPTLFRFALSTYFVLRWKGPGVGRGRARWLPAPPKGHGRVIEIERGGDRGGALLMSLPGCNYARSRKNWKTAMGRVVFPTSANDMSIARPSLYWLYLFIACSFSICGWWWKVVAETRLLCMRSVVKVLELTSTQMWLLHCLQKWKHKFNNADGFDFVKHVVIQKTHSLGISKTNLPFQMPTSN